MATRIGSATQTLSQLRESMDIRKDQTTRFAEAAEIRARAGGPTKVKTGKAFFTKEPSRLAHQELGRARVLAAFNESLRACGAINNTELHVVALNARQAVAFPEKGPVTWGTFLAAEKHVEALQALLKAVPGLTLLSAEEVLLAGSAHGARGADALTQAAVGRRLLTQKVSAEEAWKQELRPPKAAAAKVEREHAPTAKPSLAPDTVRLRGTETLVDARYAELQAVLQRHPELLAPANEQTLQDFLRSVRINPATPVATLVTIPLTELRR